MTRFVAAVLAVVVAIAVFVMSIYVVGWLAEDIFPGALETRWLIAVVVLFNSLFLGAVAVLTRRHHNVAEEPLTPRLPSEGPKGPREL